MKRAHIVTVALAALALSLAVTAVVTAEPSSADRIQAGEEFRRGVQSYYRGAFNDAILVFERALSLIPGEPVILDWLGKAYYRSGVESAAIQQWQFASGSGYGGDLLTSRLEVVRERRVTRPAFDEASRFVEAAQISSKGPNGPLYRQPVSVVPLPDGTFWVVAYGSNEIVRIDVNGVIVSRSRGPLSGFDRPFDLVRRADGSMLVSEVAADRISVLNADGSWVSSFGKKGRGLGELIGPQYIAVATSGNVFVTDYGNARVVVFDPEGNPLFSFGSKSKSFRGFVAPAGIAISGERVYVADNVTGALHLFDLSGNYIEEFLPEGSIRNAESIRPWNGGLVMALPTKALYLDPETGARFELASLGNAPSRVTGLCVDANGNLVMADYKGGFVQIATKTQELVGGLFAQIERVRSDAYPRVELELRVQDREGRPIVGLKDKNFLITEEGRPVSSVSFDGAGYLDDAVDITVIIERSPSSARHLSETRTALDAIARAMNGKGTLTLVSASALPTQEGSGNPATGKWAAYTPKAAISPRWAFDLAVRLAVNDLVNASRKRAVVFLRSGEPGESSFNRYSLNDLASYMTNNGVIFSAVSLDNSALPDEYAYLTERTGGKAWYVWDREGLAPLVRHLTEAPNGMYLLSYTSAMQTDFGKRYLPVEAEVYLMNRSGRDESGYFAPLE